MTIILRLGVFLIFAACSSGPRAQTLDPPTEALSSALEGANQDPSAELTETFPNNWWELFNDAQLTEFVETTLSQNPTLLEAQAKVAAALYAANQYRASIFPSLFWNGDVSRQKISETGVIPFGPPPGTPPGTLPPVGAPFVSGLSIPAYFTLYETELNFSYDFDIWGKNRNTWRAALSEVQAQMADTAFVRLQLGIAVAQTYLHLQIDYQRQKIAEALVENKTSYAKLVKNRLTGHLGDDLAVLNAQNDVSSAQLLLLQIQGDIAIYEYQLKAYLAGEFNEEIEALPITAQQLPKVPIPQDLPLHLVARRPDIIAQLWLIQSAGFRIDVAKAGFYPDFNLIALAGFQTIHLHKLFWGKSGLFNVDPAFSLPLFEGGRLIANLRNSEVNYDIAIFRYNELVLNAAQEVMTALAVWRNAEQQLETLQKQTVYQENLLRLTSLRQAHNINSGLDVVISEGLVLTAKNQEMIALDKSIQAILALIKAIGGGYKACFNDEGNI